MSLEWSAQWSKNCFIRSGTRAFSYYWPSATYILKGVAIADVHNQTFVISLNESISCFRSSKSPINTIYI